MHSSRLRCLHTISGLVPVRRILMFYVFFPETLAAGRKSKIQVLCSIFGI